MLVLDDGNAITFDKATNKLVARPKDLFDYNQYFKYESNFIKIKSDPKMVFDLLNNKKAPHSPVGAYDKKASGFANQNWKFEADGTIWSPVCIVFLFY